MKRMTESEDKHPRHIAIILDGNRRWAKEKGLKPWEGHDSGSERLRELFQWGKELNIKEFSLYTFSMQNFSRPEKEVNFLMKLFEKAFKEILTTKEVFENKVRVKVLGRMNLLPENVRKAMKEAIEKTKDHDQYTVNFCIAYGGREEIVDAVKKLVSDVEEGKIAKEDIDKEAFKEYLYTKSEPDLIIRTGGANRTSNFLMWQQAYSEWMFIDKYWPDFTKEDLVKAIEEFKKRERRFGK